VDPRVGFAGGEGVGVAGLEGRVQGGVPGVPH